MHKPEKNIDYEMREKIVKQQEWRKNEGLAELQKKFGEWRGRYEVAPSEFKSEARNRLEDAYSKIMMLRATIKKSEQNPDEWGSLSEEEEYAIRRKVAGMPKEELMMDQPED